MALKRQPSSTSASSSSSSGTSSSSLTSIWSYLCYVSSHVTIEPVYFMFSLSQGLYLLVAGELYIDKVCKVNMDFGEEVCNNIQNHKEQQVLVQQQVSLLRMASSIIQALPSILFSLFAGPWSDRFGRKPLIVSALFGFVFNNGVYIINTYFFYELRAEYLLFDCLQDLTGGFVVFFMSVNAYLADVTDRATRTKRMAFMAGLWPLGYNIGKALGGLIKTRLGFMYNFGFGMAMSTAAMLYVAFFVEDSLALRRRREAEAGAGAGAGADLAKPAPEKSEPEESVRHKLQILFSLDNLKSGLSTLLRPRPDNLRLYILLLIFCFETEMFVSIGEWSVMYLYLRRVLGFDLADYTYYSIAVGCIGMTAQYITIPVFSQVFRLHDSTIVLIGMLGSLVQALINSAATSAWMVYASAGVAFLEATSFSMIRCMISKYVEPDEVGKLLSIAGALQSAIPLVAGPFYGMLYRQTVKDLPQAYLLVIVGLLCVNLSVVLFVNKGLRRIDKRDKKLRMVELLREEKDEVQRLMLTKEIFDSAKETAIIGR